MVLRNAEVLRSQRLDHVSGSMIAVYEAQDSFVDGACDIELSERILSNSHIREILMRKHFENSRRNFRETGFRIVSVP